MNVSDYIVQFFFEKGNKDFFGYQGTMISYFVDAIHNNPNVHNHSCYNEQGAAFAACGYSQAAKTCGVAYATCGPGAANLLSGIANAYFDSEAVIFITGQLNTYEFTGIEGVRQHGIQDMDIVSIVKPITKWAIQLDKVHDVKKVVEKAWHIANTGRKGPVLIDLPMNIQRTEIDIKNLEGWKPQEILSTSDYDYSSCLKTIMNELKNANRPVLLVGNGISDTGRIKLREIIEEMQIPVITSMIAKDFFPYNHPLNFGHIGGSYGMRAANLLACAKADLLICLGISMCTRHTGTKVSDFAPNAKIIRIDIDETQLKRKISTAESDYCIDVNCLICEWSTSSLSYKPKLDWLAVCNECRSALLHIDDENPGYFPNKQIEYFSNHTLENTIVVSDVGQHMLWAGHSFQLKSGQKLLFSGGHGAMGFALPAAIGAYYTNHKPVYCISGDGAFQMNIQELEWVVREHLPIKILIMNNQVLGLIRQSQAMYFDERYEGSVKEYNYQPVSFCNIAKAYGIQSIETDDLKKINNLNNYLSSADPLIIELHLPENTVAIPKWKLGESIYNLTPFLDPNLLNHLITL